MQLWPRSGAERLPEASGDKNIAPVSEIIFIVRMQCGRDEKQNKLFPGYNLRISLGHSIACFVT